MPVSVTSQIPPAAEYNFRYVAGDSRPIVFRLLTPLRQVFPLEGSRIILEISWASGSKTLTKTAGNPGGGGDPGLTLDLPQGKIIYTPTPEESRAFLSSRWARYTLTREVLGGGERRTFLYGVIREFTGGTTRG